MSWWNPLTWLGSPRVVMSDGKNRVREWLFLVPERGGYYTTDQVVGFVWGPMERDPEQFVIIQAELTAVAREDLLQRRYALAQALEHINGNAYANAELRRCGQGEEYPEAVGD